MGKDIVDELLQVNGAHLYLENLAVQIPELEKCPHLEQEITLGYYNGYGLSVDRPIQPFNAWINARASIGYNDKILLTELITNSKDFYHKFLAKEAIDFYPRLIYEDEECTTGMVSRPVKLKLDGRTVTFDIVDKIEHLSERDGKQNLFIFKNLSFTAHATLQYGANVSKDTCEEKLRVLSSWSHETFGAKSKSPTKDIEGIVTPDIHGF